eukprot:TRINITY_DN75381_c0_g1_i1.p1 TRINITY_DN75381_c0_g1~~TRINITY_DN75381_c0_g1_i1.p1  ORF type:complete len:500 (-),score=115.51 TRINITY_DN75381_c0_g1_i1:369-1868(-)
MPPKGGPKAPAPMEFAIAEIRAGRKSWSAGTSGRLVKLNSDGVFGLPPKAIPRREVVLCGKAMFGRSRFAFEVQELDFDPKSVAALLGRSRAEMSGTSMGAFLARDLAPLHSLQIKFEDIEAVEQIGNIVSMKLAAPIACYTKPAGMQRTANLQVAKDITCGAKTIQFRLADPVQQPEGRSAERKPKVDFSVIRNSAMAQSPRLAALFRGEPAPEAPPPVTPQKKRTSEMPASIAKRLKKDARGKASSSAADKAAIDADEAKRVLNVYVKSLADTVDADWHDSYEETAEELQQWFEECGRRVLEVLRVGVQLGAEFGQCHEVLKQVADTWSNIEAIPFRGDASEDIANGDGVQLFANEDTDEDADDDDSRGTVHCPEELVSFAWPALLARAAADDSVPDAAILRMIRDAVDHGVQNPHEPAPGESKFSLPSAARLRLQQGRQRVARLAARESEWKDLPSTRKFHRMRRCIDRRFDGPKHLRTRNYDSDDEGDGAGCSVM